MNRTLGLVGVITGCWLGVPTALQGQEALESVVARATDAWMQHRVRDLVEGSDTVRLRIPGLASSSAVRPGQAVRLLGEYLGEAEELELVLRGVRYVAPDHAYAELRRRFQVRGTTEEKEESVFLGYRQWDGQWRLREVRIAP